MPRNLLVESGLTADTSSLDDRPSLEKAIDAQLVEAAKQQMQEVGTTMKQIGRYLKGIKLLQPKTLSRLLVSLA